MSNPELFAAWERKLPGVKPTDGQISAFAIGAEVGYAIATKTSTKPSEPDAEHEFRVRLTEYGLAMAHRNGEKARVLADVLASTFSAALVASATPAAVTDAGNERPRLGPNELEAIAKARPDDFFLKGSGVLKLLQGIRTLEADLRAALAASATPGSGEPVAKVTDAQIIEIAETMGKRVPGVSDYDSWGANYYRKDAEGNYSTPMVPRLAVPFARRILALAHPPAASAGDALTHEYRKGFIDGQIDMRAALTQSASGADGGVA